jgi:hypothetical protein
MEDGPELLAQALRFKNKAIVEILLKGAPHVPSSGVARRHIAH